MVCPPAPWSLSSSAPASVVYLKRYVAFGLIGLIVLHLLSRYGLALVRRISRCCSSPLPADDGGDGAGGGGHDQRRHRWLGAAASVPALELLKLALILYGRRRWPSGRSRAELRSPGPAAPAGSGAASALLMEQPDMGTRSSSASRWGRRGRRWHADPVPRRARRRAGGGDRAAIVEPYRMARLTAFLDPSPTPGHRLPGRAGPHRDRSAGCSAWGWASGREGLRPPGGPHRHDPGDHRRGRGSWGAGRGDPLRDDRLRGLRAAKAAATATRSCSPLASRSSAARRSLLLRGARAHAAHGRTAASSPTGAPT